MLPSVVQLWQFNSSGNIGGPTDFTLAYDPATLGGIPAEDLQVYHYNSSGTWEQLQVLSRDLLANTITVQTTSFSPFVIGGAIPEPTSFALISLAGTAAGFSRWRKK